MIMELKKRADELLKSIYGESASFRNGQYEAIEAALTHNRTLIVQKTGWGKSLIYFICTKIQRERGKGFTLVVSPLLALMENQLEAAERIGLNCLIVNSRTRDMRSEQIAAMIEGRVDLVLITPETLFSDDIQECFPYFSIGLFVVDEAHCISDWGHDFRLEYSRLNRIVRKMPKTVPILGTTATANDRVVDDLKKQFGEDVYISRGTLMRDSLSIQVLHLPDSSERYAWILQNVPRLPGSGIIYCLTQRDCDNLAGFLRTNNVKALAYHSGLSPEETEEAEKALKENRIKVLVATIKLGMGYDKGDIAFVIHYQQPSNIVAYYQQIGRAGRNIDRAYTFLMCGREDNEIQEYFIETAFPTEQEARAVYDTVMSNASTGISVKGIESYVNCRNNRVKKALMFLVNEEIIYKDGAKYYPSSKQFHYNREHYEEIKEIRYREQQQMRELTKTTDCLSRFVVNCLDDTTDKKCGICQNCLGYAEYPEKPDDEALMKAQEYRERLLIKIEPRKQLPNKNFSGNINIPVPNEEGICLSKYGDPGYGMLVKRGKYGNPPGFGEKLISKSAEVLKPIVEDNNIKAVTCVPSLRSNIVQKFAEQLAERLGLPFVSMISKSEALPQKKMENSYYQCRNAWGSFKLSVSSVPESVILIDDIVDSRWTMTVCGYLLTQAGCEFVFPFALADSSENRGDQS